MLLLIYSPRLHLPPNQYPYSIKTAVTTAQALKALSTGKSKDRLAAEWLDRTMV
jgi:hypothetical protein